MNLTRTTVLAQGAAAEEELRALIFNEAVVLLIVFGRGPRVEALVEAGDKMAFKMGALTHVVWVRNRADVRELLDGLRVGAAVSVSVAGCRAMTLGLTDEIRDVIGKNEEADMVRIFEAFNNALSI